MADDDEKRRAVLERTAGATVRHQNPFADLTILVHDQPLEGEFIRRWIQPFYTKNPADEAFQADLDYYLTKVDLWFDQADALAALQHLDAVNGTARAARYEQRWLAFVANKPNWDLAGTVSRFQRKLSGLEACAVQA